MKKSVLLLCIITLMMFLTGCGAKEKRNDISVVKDVVTLDHVEANNMGMIYMGIGGYGTEDDKYVYLSTKNTGFGGGIVKVDKSSGKAGYIPIAHKTEAKNSGDTTPSRLIRFDKYIMFTSFASEEGETSGVHMVNLMTVDGSDIESGLFQFSMLSLDRMIYFDNDIFMVTDASGSEKSVYRFVKDGMGFQSEDDFHVADENGNSIDYEFICGKDDSIYYGHYDTENKKYKIFAEKSTGGTPELVAEFDDDKDHAKSFASNKKYIYIRNENATEDFHQFVVVNMEDGTVKTYDEDINILWDFFADDDYFYERNSENELYRYNADGSDKTKLLEGVEGLLTYVDDDYFYFAKEEGFYRLKKDSADTSSMQELLTTDDIEKD